MAPNPAWTAQGSCALQTFDALPGHGRQRRWRDQLRRNLGQRTQHEGALQHARVRHAQRSAVDAAVAIAQQVQVQRARRVVERPLAAELVFDGPG